MADERRMRDIAFILNEYLDLPRLLSLPRFKNFSEADLNTFVDEARKFANEVVVPLNTPSDREGAHYDKNTALVRTASGFKEAFALYMQNGWGAGSFSEKDGGTGLPESVNIACAELFTAASPAFAMAPGLTKAAANVIISIGSAEQKARYASHLLSGKYSGTMCLTEPQAGSDVGNAKTTATPIKGRPGWYNICGTKRFTSYGEHDMAENIIHLVLARTPGSPQGTRGISLFIVPKYHVDENGNTAGKNNDIVCGGIEHKMGIHGSPTCTMNFGEKNSCEGELIGGINEGMKHMFLMMNEARLLVGMQGLAIAGAAYELAVQYANERIQGVDIREFKDPDAQKVAIIEHPDVRRMLMTMKANVESMRALLYTVALYLDFSHNAESAEERATYSDWVKLLTPICKAYCSDTAFDVAVLGMQVLGGAGYCSDYPMEQYVRDAKITSIYEGTNGIQSLDFVGKKIPMNGGAVLQDFVAMMKHRLAKLSKNPECGSLAKDLRRAIGTFERLMLFLAGKQKLNSLVRKANKFLGAASEEKKPLDPILLHTCALVEIFGTILCGFHLLEQAGIAERKLEEHAAQGERSEEKFYLSKLETARFFIKNLLPRVSWRIEAIKNGDRSCLKDVF